MTYQVLRHPEVQTDLMHIVDMLAEFAGAEVAKRKLSEIESSIKKLSVTPHTGSIRNDIYPHLRAIPVAGKGVITFIVDDQKQQVRIISLTYAGANWVNKLAARVR